MGACLLNLLIVISTVNLPITHLPIYNFKLSNCQTLTIIFTAIFHLGSLLRAHTFKLSNFHTFSLSPKFSQ